MSTILGRVSWMRVLAASIGTLATAFQPLPAQVAQREPLLGVAERDTGLRRKLRSLFDIGAPEWDAGFGHIQGIGASAVPVLQFELAGESNRKRRLLLLAAACLASDPAVALPERPPKDRGERLLGLMLLAALGERSNAAWIQRGLEGDRPIDRIPACLALARARGAVAVPMPDTVLADKDIGVLAAVSYAVPAISDVELSQRLKEVPQATATHELAWRAWFLGATLRPQGPATGHRAVALSAVIKPELAWRNAAAAWLSGIAPVTRNELDFTRLGPEQHLLLGRSAAWLEALWRAGMLPAVVPPSQPLLLRQRMLVLRILRAPAAAIEPDLGAVAYGLPAELQAVGCVALAARICREPDLRAKVGDRLRFAVGEGSLFDVAAGRTSDTRAADGFTFGDLAGLPELCRAGKLGTEHLAYLLERSLWQHGVHPGRAWLDLHRDLMHDLVLRRQRDAYEPHGSSTVEVPLHVLRSVWAFLRRHEPREFDLKH